MGTDVVIGHDHDQVIHVGVLEDTTHEKTAAVRLYREARCAVGVHDGGKAPGDFRQVLAEVVQAQAVLQADNEKQVWASPVLAVGNRNLVVVVIEVCNRNQVWAPQVFEARTRTQVQPQRSRQASDTRSDGSTCGACS